ncbi:MAG: general stress protein CsbD [Pricia sp.]|nr:general stress protein CsbD [Pricia sp.]
MWGKMRISYQGRYPEVTDKDMDYRQGEFDDMIDRLAIRTGQSREDVEHEIRNWDSVVGGDSS